MAPDRLLKLLKNLPDPRRYAARQELAFRFTIFDSAPRLEVKDGMLTETLDFKILEQRICRRVTVSVSGELGFLLDSKAT